MDQNLKIKAGEVVIFTRGMYSDFCIDAYLVFIKDCDLAPLAQEYMKEQPIVDWRKSNDKVHRYEQYEGFAGYLIGKEIAIPVAHREIHLGDYQNFEEEFGVPKE